MAPPEALQALRARLAQPGLRADALFVAGEELSRLAHAAAERGEAVRRVALAGDLTLDLLQHAVACAIALEGELARFHRVPIGALPQACLDPDSALRAFQPEGILIVPDWRACTPALPPDTPPQELAKERDDLVRGFERQWDILGRTGCRVIQHLLVPPPRRWRGAAERGSPASVRHRVEALNDALVAAAAGRVTWIEADRLAAQVGESAWAPARYHHAGRLACDPRFLPDYVPWFRGAWRAATGRGRKVLVLDLDDTLWGGAIGDLGVEGIALGPDHGPRGEAFAEWQHYVAQLGQRGVVLAVCSKNDPQLAAPGFAHRHSALPRAAFAAVVCSWQDKATALRQVARALDVAPDALVFADDNPAECALVRECLPEVAVVELGADPARFVELLDEGHWFDHAGYTVADFGRAASYQARDQLRSALDGEVDLAGHLRSLQMRGRLAPATEAELARLAQMEQKTNQFNLTQRRYTQAQLGALAQRPDARVLAFHLRDRFADHGIVGSLVVVAEDGALRIDNWLLSCRVFGRQAEHFILDRLCAIARECGASALRLELVRSDRNGVVADLPARLGFVAQDASGRWWRRGVADESAAAAGPIQEGD